MAGALSVEVVYALKCEISAKEAALTKLKAEVEQLKKQPAPPLLGPPPLAPPLFAPPPLAPPLLPGGLAPLAPPPPPPLPGSETAPTTAALIAPSTSMPPPTVPFHTPPVPVHSPVCLFTHQLCPPAVPRSARSTVPRSGATRGGHRRARPFPGDAQPSVKALALEHAYLASLGTLSPPHLNR